MGRRKIPNIAYKRQKYHSTADKCFLKSLGLYLPLYILKSPSNGQIIIMKARTTVRVMLKVQNKICKLWARANLKVLTVNGRMSFLTTKISGFDLTNRLPNCWINKIILGSSVAMIFSVTVLGQYMLWKGSALNLLLSSLFANLFQLSPEPS